MPRIDVVELDATEAIARLERRLVHAAPADRIVVRVFRSQLLVTKTAHRPAAAGIEPLVERYRLVRADQAADYATVVAGIAALQKGGVSNLGLITEAPQ